MSSASVDSVESLVGATPLVALARLRPQGGGRLLLKLGAYNPSGSDDDRAALAWFREREAQGGLQPGTRLVVASTGNFAVSLAWLCATRRVQLTAVVPDIVTLDRRALLRAYGARVELVPAEGGLQAARARAASIAAESGGVLVDRTLEADARLIASAFEGLADELVKDARQQGGAAPRAVFAGLSRGPALLGLSRGLSRHVPSSPVSGVEPERPLSRLGELSRHDSAEGEASVASLQVVQVSDREAHEAQVEIGRHEGLLVGIASAAAVAAARRYTGELADEDAVCVVCPDGGERDFSLEELFR